MRWEVEFCSAHSSALIVHFHTNSFLSKFAPGAENGDVNIFNLIGFISELICYLKVVKDLGITCFIPGCCPSQVTDR